MKITAQMIAFNAESTLPKGMFKACVVNMLPYVDEFIIVEGGVYKEKCNAKRFTHNGYSTDETVKVIKDLMKHSPKVKLIQTINRGGNWWETKTDMCNAAAAEAKGEYIFQVDADELWHHKDLEKIIELLEKEEPDQVEFEAHHFFGGFDRIVNKESMRKTSWDLPWKRIFKNSPNSRWISHEPPVYYNGYLGKPCHEGKVIDRDRMSSMGIYMHHYSVCTIQQARFKDLFYGNNLYTSGFLSLEKNPDIKVVWGATTEPFKGDHPMILKTNGIVL